MYRIFIEFHMQRFRMLVWFVFTVAIKQHVWIEEEDEFDNFS